jgi:mRNA-capping enzyme
MDNESYMAARAVSNVTMPDEEGAARPVEAGGAGSGPPKHDDVLGEEVPQTLKEWVLSVVHSILGLPPSLEFPGSQPVSLAQSNASLLEELPYMVSWKADGTRYLMLLMHGGVYLIDRAARVRRCQLRMPAPNVPPHHRTVHYGVLLDGEMVVDAVTPGGPPVDRRFLVYDCCALDSSSGVPTMDAPFIDRWNAVQTAIYGAKKLYEAEVGPKYRGAAEPFRLRRKDFYGIEKASWLLREFIPRQALHSSDGLIFQPQTEPYRPRTDEHLLKWKDPRLNSIDFYVHEDASSGALHLCVSSAAGGELKLLSDVTLPPPMLAELEERGASPLTAPLFVDRAEAGEPELRSGMIAECVWDGERSGWSLMRVRLDKEHPNHESVFVRVWQSICDNLQAEDVLQLLAPAVAARKARHEAQAARVADQKRMQDAMRDEI